MAYGQGLVGTAELAQVDSVRHAPLRISPVGRIQPFSRQWVKGSGACGSEREGGAGGQREGQSIYRDAQMDRKFAKSARSAT